MAGKHERPRPLPRLSRRTIIGGSAAVAAAGVVGLTQGETLAESVTGHGDDGRGNGGRGRGRPQPSVPTQPTRFGRMFNDLPPFAEPSAQLTAALLELGRPGGLLDAKDALASGPLELLRNPALSANNPNNPNMFTGFTFLGQFLDHDMTFDTGSPLGVPTAPEGAANTRTPSLDLDTVYGRGPVADPIFYRPDDRAKFVTASGGRFEDLPRMPDRQAIIPEPRNDENLMISGLQAAFQLFHNNVVDLVRKQQPRLPTLEAFAQARQLVTFHYQWIVRNEVVPTFIGPEMVDRIRREGRRFYTPQRGQAFIPVEFQGAVYRFGHSMVRPSYGANQNGNADGSGFVGFIFDPTGEGKADPPDLRGGARARRRFVNWRSFFDFGDGGARNNKRIDTKISSPLFRLPLGAIPSGDAPTALPQRNLLRHVTWSLPSGQQIARRIGAPVLGAGSMAELAGLGAGLDRSTPLFYYVLKEAQEMTDGLRLGPVGGRIVGEVFLGLLEQDPNGFLAVRGWRPTLPSRTRGTFTMADLLTFAGVGNR